MGATCRYLLSKLLHLPPLLSALSIDDSLQFKLSSYINPCRTIHHGQSTLTFVFLSNCAYSSIIIHRYTEKRNITSFFSKKNNNSVLTLIVRTTCGKELQLWLSQGRARYEVTSTRLSCPSLCF